MREKKRRKHCKPQRVTIHIRFGCLYINKSFDSKKLYTKGGGKIKGMKLKFTRLALSAEYAMGFMWKHLDKVQTTLTYLRSKVLDYKEMKLKFNESRSMEEKKKSIKSLNISTQIIRAEMKCKNIVFVRFYCITVRFTRFPSKKRFVTFFWMDELIIVSFLTMTKQKAENSMQFFDSIEKICGCTHSSHNT